MRTQSSRRAGRFHEVGFYRSDAEFGALIVPFVEEGAAAGQPVIIGYDDRKASLLRSWLSDPDAVTFLAGNRLYATPARAHRLLLAAVRTPRRRGRHPDPDRRGRAARG